MSELIKNTIEEVNKFNDEIKSDLSNKNIDTSGNASNSIRIEDDDKSVRSLGIFYLTFLDQGRGPGKFPPPDAMAGWAIRKPVEINPYLIGRKIAREGTEIYKDKNKGIMLDEKRKRLQETIKKEAPKWAKTDLLKVLKVENQKINK